MSDAAPVRRLEQHRDWVYALALHPTRNYCCCGSIAHPSLTSAVVSGSFDGELRVYDMDTWGCVARLAGLACGVLCFTSSSMMAVGCNSGAVAMVSVACARRGVELVLDRVVEVGRWCGGVTHDRQHVHKEGYVFGMASTCATGATSADAPCLSHHRRGHVPAQR